MAFSEEGGATRVCHQEEYGRIESQTRI